MLIYLIGSLRNPEVPKVASKLRAAGLTVFDEWYSAGPNADDHLRDHFAAMGLNHKETLQTAAARNIFEFDKRHISRDAAVVLLMPAGKSGFLELGWALGQGKRGYILFDKDPERIDVMFQFADAIAYSIEELIECLCQEFTINTTRTLPEGQSTLVVPPSGETPSSLVKMGSGENVWRGIENIYSTGLDYYNEPSKTYEGKT
jgi:hypothetical protein